MAGQEHRLTLPATQPLADIDADIENFSKLMALKGVTGFVLAFNYRQGNKLLHIACLHQNQAAPALTTITPTLESVLALNELLWVTDERNTLKQPRRYCAPKLIYESAPIAPRHNPFREQNIAAQYLNDMSLRDGWRHYSHRFDNIPPHWKSTEGILHLKREQGLGEELFFLRFARGLQRRIVYYATPKILELASRLTELPHVEFRPETEAPQYAMPVGELPSRTTPDFVPLPLKIETTGLERLAARQMLERSGLPPYTLVTWKAGKDPKQQTSGVHWGAYKSAPLEPFGKMLRALPGTIISVQRDPLKEDEQELMTHAKRQIIPMGHFNDKLELMVHLLAACDCYIGVSNTNMHLMAGLENPKPTHVLIPHPAHWQYTSWLPRSPWFPGFKLYRQSQYGDWSLAFEQLRANTMKGIS